MNYLKVGDIITIPRDAVSPCLHHTLENAIVTGFRNSACDGLVIEFFTLRPWQCSPNWPINHTIAIPFSSILYYNLRFAYAPPPQARA